MTSLSPKVIEAAWKVTNEISPLMLNSKPTTVDMASVVCSVIALAIDKAVEEERAKLDTLLLGGTLSKHGRIVSVELSGGNLATDLFNVLAAIRTRKQEDDR